MRFTKKLLDLSDTDNNEPLFWTLKDAFEGVQVFGGIGSGKTSGSGKALSGTFLKNGFGGLVLCAKTDEADRWIKLAVKYGRSKDLIVFREKKTEGQEEFFFNPLEYEAKREGGGETFNLVNLFMQIYQMGQVISGEGLASSGERFWDNALKRCLGRMIDLLNFAGEDISIENMYKLISQTLSRDEVDEFSILRKRLPEKSAWKEILQWASSNYYVRCYANILNKFDDLNRNQTVSEKQLEEKVQQVGIARNYFERELPNLAEKTKTIIVESFLGLAEPFQSGILKKYFAGKTTLSPEIIFEKGKIVILDFPIKNYLDSGIYAQGLFKLLFQQAIERRVYEPGNIPVFLWVDESQNFLNTYDQIFQTTARSAGVSTVFITQNISNYYVAIGGKNPEARVNSLLGNLSTKIFHNNNDYVTNEWASKLIGKTWKNIESMNIGQNQSFGLSKQYHWEVEPSEFSRLRKGGQNNDYEVDAVIVMSDEVSSEKNYLFRTFRQK